jgi:hypothetical protein
MARSGNGVQWRSLRDECACGTSVRPLRVERAEQRDWVTAHYLCCMARDWMTSHHHPSLHRRLVPTLHASAGVSDIRGAGYNREQQEERVSERVIHRARQGEARAWLERHLESINDWSPTECVLWPFSTNGGSGGRYPQVNIDGRVLRVTRYVFAELAGRPLARGEVIRHSCDEPRCVNGWHFSTGSQFDNVQDMLQRQRQACGERNGRAQLTEEQVRDIRALAREHDLRRDVAFVARAYGVSPAALTLVLKGETWPGVV